MPFLNTYDIEQGNPPKEDQMLCELSLTHEFTDQQAGEIASAAARILALLQDLGNPNTIYIYIYI